MRTKNAVLFAIGFLSVNFWLNDSARCQTSLAPPLSLARPAPSPDEGAPKQFSRKDLEKPVTREFCAECGTHMVTRPQRPIVVVKVGTLDNPAQIKPQIAIYTVDKQPFHHIPEGMPSFERLPQR